MAAMITDRAEPDEMLLIAVSHLGRRCLLVVLSINDSEKPCYLSVHTHLKITFIIIKKL